MADTKTAKRAQLIASAITVVCPHCGAIQPAPDNGSDLWEPAHIELAMGQTRACTDVNCDKLYLVPAVVASVRMP